MNLIFMEILTIPYTYIWNLYPKKYIIVFCQKNVEIKKKKRQTVKSEYAHKHITAM